MKTISVEIVGTGRGYLQHRRNVAGDFEEAVTTTKRKSRQPTTMAEFKEEAVSALWADEKGRPYIPSIQIERALIGSGSAFQIAGHGKRTYKRDMLASIIVTPPKIYLTPPKWETDIQAVRVQSSQVFRARPLFEAGWKAKFSIQITDDEIQSAAVKDILEYAGKHVGIGDYRPRYGTFDVVSSE